MTDLGIAEAIRQAQGWCPLCGGSGMVMEFQPVDCANLDVHRELAGLLRYVESVTARSSSERENT